MKGHELLRASEWSVMMCVRNVPHRLIHLNTWLQLWLTYLLSHTAFSKGEFSGLLFFIVVIRIPKTSLTFEVMKNLGHIV